MTHGSGWLRALVSRKLLLIPLSLGVLLVGVVSLAEAQTILRVDVGAPGLVEDGATWGTAYRDLQDALAAADAGGGSYEIWVAAGTYKPTELADRDATFQLESGVALYGGFVGTETSREDRNWTNNQTILSGDIGVTDNSNDNCYHVVRGCDNAVLDGFTITRGHANGIADGNNLERMFGGGMANFGTSPTVRNCTFFDNAADSGGGMVNFGGNPAVTDCSFEANTADLYGGGMWNRMSSPTVTHCTFSGNWADEEGGGMSNDEGSDATVTDCSFDGNSAWYGGGMSNYMSSPTVTDSAFSDNMALIGGGMDNYMSSSPAVTDCIFGGNWAWYGGGMSNDAGSDPTVAGCLFDSNVAGGDDETRLSDGIRTHDRHHAATRSRANDATALEVCSGGGMYNFDSSPTVTECTFINNEAGDGGGMCNDESSPEVGDCSFDGNWAWYGGGMSNYMSSPTVTDSAFSDNIALIGGGMSNDESSPTITGCTFSGNVAVYGGGMDNYLYSSPQVTHCSFRGNWAWYGGGMDNEAGSNPTVTDCTFSDNVAEEAVMARLPDGIGADARDHVAPRGRADEAGEPGGWGGGMANLDCNPTVTNCTFSGNEANNGGGMYNDYNSSPTVTNCTFYGNSGAGAGMHNNASNPTVKNTILAGNIPEDCYICANSTFNSLGYNLDSDGSCIKDGVNHDMTRSAPLLDPNLQDNGGPTKTHALLSGSPALDAIPSPDNYNGAPPTDQRGVVRPQGARCDIGAFERELIKGDVNGDGSWDLLDVVLCQQIASGLVHGTAAQRAAADVDDDGDVDANDVTILSEYVVGIRTTLP